MGLYVIRVGSDDRPATQTDIDLIADQLREMDFTDEPVIVTHHSFDLNYFTTPTRKSKKKQNKVKKVTERGGGFQIKSEKETGNGKAKRRQRT